METGTSASHSVPCMETLEARELLAAGGPTAYAQYLLELINRARANPAAEAARYSIALNEGLAAGTISTSAKGPLAFNQALIDAAVAHEAWMFQTELFQHTGMNSTSPAQRIADAGYVAVVSGENIGVFQPGSGLPNMISDTAGLEESLFVDTTDAARANRLRLMDSGFREVGIGVLGGSITGGSAIAATEDFATASTTPFLTGVVYDNRLALMDDFYTPGEGLGDVIVTAVKHGGGTFTTTTWNSGGYSLALAAGIYDVTFSGGALGGSFAYPNVVVGTSNVKQDFVADNPPPTADLTVTPTPANARTIYVRPGAAYSLQAAIRNIGNARADGPFNVVIYRSADATVDPTDTPIDTYALASLATHATNTATRALTAPALAGTYYLAVHADDTNVVNESLETNNWGSVITLIVGEPDLQAAFASSFHLPAMLVPGDHINVPFVITNAGTIPAAGNVASDIYASIGLTPNAGDQLLASVTRSINLAPGASTTVTVSVAITEALPVATWHILADVDTTNAVLESDETNNTVATAGTFDQVWRFGSFADRRGVKLVVHDGTGTLVTFAASGPGFGDVALVASGFDVTLTGDTASTNVTITTNGPRTALHNVTAAGSVGKFTAKADLVGTFDAAGSIASLSLGDVTDAQISLHTNGALVISSSAKAALALGAVTNSDIDAGDEPVSSLKALEWLDSGGPADTLDAPAIGSITISGQKANPAKGLVFLAGDFEPALTAPGAVGKTAIAGTLRGAWDALSVASLKAANIDAATLTLSQTVDPKHSALGSLTVTQWMTDTRILAAGNVGAVSLAGVSGSDIFASVVPQPHGLPDPTTAFVALPHATIKSVTVTGKVVDGLGHSLIDSDFAAYTLGAFNLANALATNVPSKAWGLAGHTLASYKYHETGLTYTWSIAMSPVPIVPVGDFAVSLA